MTMSEDGSTLATPDREGDTMTKFERLLEDPNFLVDDAEIEAQKSLQAEKDLPEIAQAAHRRKLTGAARAAKSRV